MASSDLADGWSLAFAVESAGLHARLSLHKDGSGGEVLTCLHCEFPLAVEDWVFEGGVVVGAVDHAWWHVSNNMPIGACTNDLIRP